MATFAPDALLNDIQREFIGTKAIRAFADAEIFGAIVTMPSIAPGIATATSRSMLGSMGRMTRQACLTR